MMTIVVLYGSLCVICINIHFYYKYFILNILMQEYYRFVVFIPQNNVQLRRYPMFERTVPLMAVISANMVNIPCMRIK